MFENIDVLLSIDPTYLALFGAMSLGMVQVVKAIVKSFNREVGNMALPLNVLFATCFAALLVNFDDGWRQGAISTFVLAYLIASSASGTYSWVKKTEVKVEIPDYSDES
jgi:hypothetical protein